MGFDPDEKPPTGALIQGMLFMLIGNFFLVYVLAHNMGAYDPVSWGQEATGASAISVAGMASFFTWLGFFLPVDMGIVTWEKKSWKLFGINTSYHLLNLLLVAAVIAYMG